VFQTTPKLGENLSPGRGRHPRGWAPLRKGGASKNPLALNGSHPPPPFPWGELLQRVDHSPLLLRGLSPPHDPGPQARVGSFSLRGGYPKKNFSPFKKGPGGLKKFPESSQKFGFPPNPPGPGKPEKPPRGGVPFGGPPPPR